MGRTRKILAQVSAAVTLAALSPVSVVEAATAATKLTAKFKGVAAGTQLLAVYSTGASARAMLASAAAALWQVPASQISVQQGVVSHPSGKRARFGELSALAAQQPRPTAFALKTTEQFTLIGRDLPRFEIASKVDGSAVFGIDVRPPGLLYAMVAMNPELGAGIERVDDQQVRAMSGVKNVVQLPELYGSTAGVAVVAS